MPKSEKVKNPKLFDQPRITKNGKLTQNGLFAQAVEDYKNRKRKAEIVRAYEKIFDGVWSEKGFFKLIDYRYKNNGSNRRAFKYILEEIEIDLIE